VRRLLAAFLAFIPFTVCADQLWAVGTVGSYHVENNGYCQFNPGVGVEYGGEKVRFVAGTYQNSLCYNSNYVGVSYAPLKLGDFKFGAALLGVTGYKVKVDRRSGKFSDDPAFAPLPFISYERRHFGVNVLVIPPFDDFSGALGFQIKFRF
jgi:hypothetical protein